LDKKNFEIEFLEDAYLFLEGLDIKARMKIIGNIEKASKFNLPTLFKKLSGDLWEFRTKYSGNEYRLLAFWDKTGEYETLVVATHGFIKKTQKTPEKEKARATKLRRQYFEEKEDQ